MPQMPAIPIQSVAPQCSTAQKTSPQGFRSIHTGMPTLYLVPGGRCRPMPMDGEEFSSPAPRKRREIFFLAAAGSRRSEEHTSELQSLAYLVCRLLLEKKKQKI